MLGGEGMGGWGRGALWDGWGGWMGGMDGFVVEMLGGGGEMVNVSFWGKGD